MRSVSAVQGPRYKVQGVRYRAPVLGPDVLNTITARALFQCPIFSPYIDSLYCLIAACQFDSSFETRVRRLGDVGREAYSFADSFGVNCGVLFAEKPGDPGKSLLERYSVLV
jgi:hypothetical protein